MHPAIKNPFPYDETLVLIAGIENLIFYCWYEVHFGANWLLKRDSPPQLVTRSIKILQEQIMGLNVFCRIPSNKNLYTLKLVLVPFK